MAEENDIEESDTENGELSLHGAGEMLRNAREQKNQTIEDVAKITRIPQRHLSSIEASDFDALPGRTYAIGFGKSYARAVGLSEATIGSKLREEMDEQGHAAYQPETSGYAPSNPTSIPPKYLAWTAAGIGALILVGYLVWRTLFLSPATIDLAADDSSATEAEASDNNLQSPNRDTGPAPSTSGTVVLTATATVWLKIYDEDGERLFEKQMSAGEKYTVPNDAKGPQILTGRADALTVTIDGKVVPALGTGKTPIKDIGISAAALVGRNEAGGTATGNSTTGQ